MRSKISAQDLRTRYAVFSKVPGKRCRCSVGTVALTFEDDGISVSILLRAWSSEMKEVPIRSVIVVLEVGLGNLAKALRSGPSVVMFCGYGNETVPF